jgi:hypothetical protein
MYITDKYTVVATSMSEVPVKALSSIKPQVAAALGGPVSGMFPEFASCFPLTVSSMETHWSKPKLALMDRRRCLAFVFIERETLNLFFDDPYPIYASEPYFEVSMMPLGWDGLYRSMSSFCITDQSVHSPLGWRNTPLPRSMDVDQFSNETNIKKDKLKAFEKQLGVTQERKLRCWMITDGHDSLWIDEQHCDKKVYHVRKDAFTEAYVLPNPVTTLDQYLAHVVAGRLPQDFDFRKVN